MSHRSTCILLAVFLVGACSPAPVAEAPDVAPAEPAPTTVVPAPDAGAAPDGAPAPAPAEPPITEGLLPDGE